MDETFSTKAIILNKQAYKENDTRVSVFCLGKGRLELVARGTRKASSKLAGHIEPITLSRVMVVRGKKLNYLGSAINEESFLDIKNDYNKLVLAGKGINIFKRLVKENEDDKELFDLLNNFLDILNNADADNFNYELFYNFFVLKLISELGYRPELHNCVVCKCKIKPGKNKFSLLKGGIVCSECKEVKEALTITDNCIKVMRMVIRDDLMGAMKITINNDLNKEIKKIISLFYKYNF